MSNPRGYEQYAYMYVHTYRCAYFYMYLNVCTKHQGLFSSSRGMDMCQFSKTRITLMVDILHNCYIILCMKKNIHKIPLPIGILLSGDGHGKKIKK